MNIDSKSKFQGINFYLIKDIKSFFHQLCWAFTTSLILCNFDLLFFIYMKTNVLDFVILGILVSQQYLKTSHWDPIVFWLRKKTVIDINYGTDKSEMLAIIEGCKL